MAGINIDADLGVRGFLKGTKDMEEALQDVSDELEDTAKEGDKGLEKLSDKLAEAAKAAKKAGDDIEKSVGGGTKRGAAQAVDATETVQKEAVANLSETVSSFDGTVSSFAGAIQGTLGGIIQDLSGMGLALGVAGAVGVGYLIKEFEKAEIDAERMKERIGLMAEQLIETGDVSLSFVIDQMKQLASETEDGVTNLSDLAQIANAAEESLGALATAYAGDAKGLKQLVEQKKAQLKVEKDTAEALKAANGEMDAGALAAQGKAQATQVYVEKLDAAAKGAEEAQKAEEDWLAAGGEEMLTKQAMVESINTAYDDAAGSVDDFVNEESKIFDVEAYLTAMHERETALKNYQETLTTSGLSNEAMNFLNEQGVEAASQMLAGYQSSSPETKKELDRIWSEASKEASGSVQTELDKVIKKKQTATIGVDVETQQAIKDLEQITKDRAVKVTIDWRDKYGKPVY
jgi:hypothetical protein